MTPGNTPPARPATGPVYQRLSIAEKQRAWYSAHAAPVRCRRCDTQLLPQDMSGHLEQRCAGTRERRDALLLATHALQTRPRGGFEESVIMGVRPKGTSGRFGRAGAERRADSPGGARADVLSPVTGEPK